MKKLLALFLSAPCMATNPGAMDIEAFQGTKIVIGTGTEPKLLGQRQTSNTTEYSIDIDRRVYPSLVADGLDARTYIAFPDRGFDTIPFEHVSFCPYDRPNMLTALGGYRRISTGIYTSQAWTDSFLNASLGLPTQFHRILKAGGKFVFCTPVLEDRNHFREMCLDQDENALKAGLQAWKDIYELVGFEEITFEPKQHETLKGWFMSMTAIKTRPLKRNRTEPVAVIERQHTQIVMRTWSFGK